MQLDKNTTIPSPQAKSEAFTLNDIRLTPQERRVLAAILTARNRWPSPYGSNFIQIRDAYAWSTPSEPIGPEQIHRSLQHKAGAGEKWKEIITWRLRKVLDRLAADRMLEWTRVSWASAGRRRAVGEGTNAPLMLERKPRRHWRITAKGAEALRVAYAGVAHTWLMTPEWGRYGVLSDGTPEEISESERFVEAEYIRRHKPAAMAEEERARIALSIAGAPQIASVQERRGPAYRRRLEEAKQERARRRLERTLARLPKPEAERIRAALRAAEVGPEGAD